MGGGRVAPGGGLDLGDAEDLTALSEEELRSRLEGMVEEERSISYRRRVLQGRIDLIRAELAGRGAVAASPEALARVLMGESPGEAGGCP